MQGSATEHEGLVGRFLGVSELLGAKSKTTGALLNKLLCLETVFNALRAGFPQHDHSQLFSKTMRKACTPQSPEPLPNPPPTAQNTKKKSQNPQPPSPPLPRFHPKKNPPKKKKKTQIAGWQKPFWTVSGSWRLHVPSGGHRSRTWIQKYVLFFEGNVKFVLHFLSQWVICPCHYMAISVVQFSSHLLSLGRFTYLSVCQFIIEIFLVLLRQARWRDRWLAIFSDGVERSD